jgi:hypothetical protein
MKRAREDRIGKEKNNQTKHKTSGTSEKMSMQPV